ncbi:hypothetical protein [Mesorhizobium sp. CAU 1732]|uniref:DUF7940 domain-containing protein n=1 Tax=Mesorhizobium sp. CAU 1732 TaxID=3140358 RepID=UPI0032605109
MKPVPDWRRVLRRAWSVRLMILAALLSGVEVVLPFLGDRLPVSAGVFAALSGIATAGAFAARFVAQKGITDVED